MKLESAIVENIEEATNTQYKKYYVSDNEKKVLVVAEEIESMFEDLLDKIENLEKEIDYMREDVRENYKRIPVENQYE
jgi:hypothetical protein